jgi:6-phosphogluconolactonase (cycloisomerase 2 family)
LLVVTKASGSKIDVFSVSANGRLSDAPRVNASATPVPFSFTFDPISGRLVVAETGASDLSTYTLGSDGSLTDPHSLSDGQTALCWVTRVGGFYYVSNTDSSTLSRYTLGTDGAPALIGTSGIVTTTESGPIDSAASSDARFLSLDITATVVPGFGRRKTYDQDDGPAGRRNLSIAGAGYGPIRGHS